LRRKHNMNRRFFFMAAAVLGLAALLVNGCAGSPKPDVHTAELSVVSPVETLSYYVRADGSDRNDGLTEDTPFKTLRWAVDAADKGKIKTITVLGTLNAASEGQSSIYPDSVFIIRNTQSEITIKGKGGGEQGILSAAGANKRVLLVLGKSRIRLEHLRIEGGATEYSGAGIGILEQAQVTIGEGVTVQDNHSKSPGGGVGGTGTFTMRGGTISGNTSARFGGGIYISTPAGAVFTKSGGTIDAANSAGAGRVALVDTGETGSEKRDSAAGPEVNLDSTKAGSEGGWE
jgi:hypothetical protein